MARKVVAATRARGSLAIDPKSHDGAASLAERALAWDEDETTLAIEAAAALPHSARVAIVGPGIDVETFRVALDLATVHSASDPMGVAMHAAAATLAVGCPPGTASAIAALVDESDAADISAPTDVSPPPRMVSAQRALAESRRVPPEEEIPDQPMGAYVPRETWVEDLPARLRLLAQRCKACARTLYPPRGACPQCGGRAFDEVPLARDGARLYAATRIGRGGAPSEFALEQAQVGAYWVGVLEWPEHGVRVTARLSGFDDGEPPRIGEAVRPLVRRLFEQEGRTRYGVKFSR